VSLDEKYKKETLPYAIPRKHLSIKFDRALKEKGAVWFYDMDNYKHPIVSVPKGVTKFSVNIPDIVKSKIVGINFYEGKRMCTTRYANMLTDNESENLSKRQQRQQQQKPQKLKSKIS